MKTCSRCGSNLEKRGHSISCPLGKVIKEIDEGKPVESIRIAFPNDEMKRAYGDMMARTAQLMASTKTFFDVVTELDDNAPDLTDQVAPHLEKFIVDLMLIYPSPDLFDTDLKTLLGKETE